MPAPDKRSSEPGFAEPRARTVTLPTSSASPWLSRQLLAQWCREWALSGAVVDEALVVVSELVTACVASGAAVVSLSAALRADQLELAVDATARQPRPGDVLPDDDAAERRMEILRALGSSVEVRAGAASQTVVVAVPLSRAP